MLTGVQAGVKLTLPKADVSEKTIKADSKDIDVGGNMAAVVALMAKDKGLPPALAQTAGNFSALQRHDSRLRFAQRGQPGAGSPLGAAASLARAESALEVTKQPPTKNPQRCGFFVTAVKAVLIWHGLCRNHRHGCRFRSCHRFR